jgi:hypothetical protein
LNILRKRNRESPEIKLLLIKLSIFLTECTLLYTEIDHNHVAAMMVGDKGFYAASLTPRSTRTSITHDAWAKQRIYSPVTTTQPRRDKQGLYT